MKWNIRYQHALPLACGITKQNSPVTHERSLPHLILPAEPENLRSCSAGQCNADRIVGVQNRKVVCLLVFKDAGFSINVGFESAMPIEVVRRNIEHHGNLGPESLNRLKLEAGDLQNDD